MKIEPKPQRLGRKLLYFPIAHTQADMGKLGDAVKSLYLRKIGRSAWNRKIDLVNKFWDQVAEIISNVQIEETTTRVYQDGLPVTNDGKEFEIIQKLADAGSRNHLLVVRLVKRGAILMGTESINLLMAEYDITRKYLENQSSGKPGMGKKIRESEDDILKKRDQFIASRINQTLGEGELGIIFLGMLHDIKPWLSEDIEVVFPVLIEAGKRPS